MKMEAISITLTRLQATEHQLNAAIRLFLDSDDYVSAITLGGGGRST